MARSLYLVALSLAAAGCSAAPGEERDGDVAVLDTSALSASSTPLVGHWRSKTAVDDLYATELRLDDDGTFEGQLRRETIDGSACVEGAKDACVIAAHGRWRVSVDDKLQLRVLKSGYVSEGKRVAIEYDLSSVPRTLTLRGAAGQQIFAEHFGCAETTCPTGARCEESGGATRCVAIAPRNQR